LWYNENVLCSYDYEKVDSAGADKMVERLNTFIADKANIGKEYRAGGKTLKIAKLEDFEYTDPIDQSVAKNQVEACDLSERIIYVSPLPC